MAPVDVVDNVHCRLQHSLDVLVPARVCDSLEVLVHAGVCGQARLQQRIQAVAHHMDVLDACESGDNQWRQAEEKCVCVCVCVCVCE